MYYSITIQKQREKINKIVCTYVSIMYTKSIMKKPQKFVTFTCSFDKKRKYSANLSSGKLIEHCILYTCEYASICISKYMSYMPVY